MKNKSNSQEGSGAPTCYASWDAVLADHASITFWRTGWARADKNRASKPTLQTKAEYIERRWSRANNRMGRFMKRVDEWRRIALASRIVKPTCITDEMVVLAVGKLPLPMDPWHIAQNLNSMLLHGYCRNCGLVPHGCAREGCGHNDLSHGFFNPQG